MKVTSLEPLIPLQAQCCTASKQVASQAITKIDVGFSCLAGTRARRGCLVNVT